MNMIKNNNTDRKMNSAIILLFFLTIARFVRTHNIVCFYNPEDSQNFGFNDLETAVSYCDHLVYGYAGIDPENYRIKSLRPTVELPTGDDFYRKVTNLKKKYPHLKVYLSIGGRADPEKETYLSLLEDEKARAAFTSSVYNFIRVYGFDGVDIAWQFPESEPKRRRGFFKKFWHGVKNIFTQIDSREEEHREQFKLLIQQLKHFCKVDNLSVTLSVNPNVNSTIYYDVENLIHNVDQVHLHTYDYYTPERNPYEADLTAPLKEPVRENRYPDANVDANIQYWLSQGAPATKIIFVIPTFGRTWKMTDESSVNGHPPLIVNGPGEKGTVTKKEGFLNYYEIWKGINSPFPKEKLNKVDDLTKQYGTFAFRLPDADGEHGIWVSFDDMNIVNQKAILVKTLNLGGIGIYNIIHDDPNGLTGSKYPILSVVRSTLKVIQPKLLQGAQRSVQRGALMLGRKH